MADAGKQFRPRLDELDMEMLHNALAIYLRWLNGTLDEEYIPTDTDRDDDTQADISLIYVAARNLRARLVRAAGGDLGLQWWIEDGEFRTNEGD